MRTWPRSHSVERQRDGENHDARRARRPDEPRRAGGEGGEKRQARRHQRHRKGQQPGKLVGLDEKGLADPEQPEQEIAEAEPPSRRRRANGGTSPKRCGLDLRAWPRRSATRARAA